MHYDLSYLSNLVTLCELETYDHKTAILNVSYFIFKKENSEWERVVGGVLFFFSFWVEYGYSICKEFMDITVPLYNCRFVNE